MVAHDTFEKSMLSRDVEYSFIKYERTTDKTILYCTGTSGAVLVLVQNYVGFAC